MVLSTSKLSGERQSEMFQNPQSLVHATNDELFSLETDFVQQIQLAGAQKRFDWFYPRIKALKKLADEQNITEIKTLNDLAPILFLHTVYKSYPLAFIEKKKFDKLTVWLDKLTTHDLSAMKTDNCNSIDSWLEAIEKQSDLQIVHSTGTTGKLSFLPRSESEMENFKNAFYLFIEVLTGVNPHKTKMPVFFPSFADGRQLAQRILSRFGPMLAGSKEEYHTAIPGYLSADFMSLAGRLQAAKAKGELGKLQMLKALSYNRGELIRLKRNRPKYMAAFFDNMVKNYRGRQVFMLGTLTSMIDAALEGEKQGLSNVFASNSALVTGGGLKGQVVPEDWYERICTFYGVKNIRDGYGMTESTGYMPSCDQNHYHIYPHFIPFVFDIGGQVLPRTGVQTGRFGFYDLLTESYWGGFLTGDEVTIHWDDDQCSCGRTGPWLEKKIQRISEKNNGDDKISCAGSQEAYDSFIDYLLDTKEE
ncbi:hypothetical protein CEE45_12795 [Candidatus Heimdallarchaeota archaeon B3_Heim]|nr:MAG: hypothetical protein CEE45_12795 [Candidatus Heimdallarchaeota archaeon B3_Heim]